MAKSKDTKKTPTKIRNKDVAAGTPKSNNNDGSFAEHRKSVAASPFDSLTDNRIANLMELSVRSAERWCRRRGIVDSESINDVASESIAQLFDAIKKRGELMENPEGYLQAVVKNEASAASATVSKSARSGFNALNDRVEKAGHQLGRSLTNEELNAEAEALLENWPDQKHKPPKDFWKKGPTRAVRGVSFSDPENEHKIVGSVFGNTDAARIDDRVVFEDSITNGRWSASLLNIAENGRSSEGNVFRYNAHAENVGAPMAIPGSMTRRETDNARNAVKKAIGPVKAKKDQDPKAYSKEMSAGFVKIVHSWENGEKTIATESLFKPFGENTGTTTRQEIVSALTFRPEFSHELWSSALGAASNSNYHRIMRALGENPEPK